MVSRGAQRTRENIADSTRAIAIGRRPTRARLAHDVRCCHSCRRVREQAKLPPRGEMSRARVEGARMLRQDEREDRQLSPPHRTARQQHSSSDVPHHARWTTRSCARGAVSPNSRGPHRQARLPYVVADLHTDMAGRSRARDLAHARRYPAAAPARAPSAAGRQRIIEHESVHAAAHGAARATSTCNRTHRGSAHYCMARPGGVHPAALRRSTAALHRANCTSPA